MAPGSLRILQVHNRYRQLGGEDAVVAAEADLLRRSGHEVVEHFVSNPTGSAAAAATLAAAPWNPASARAMRSVVRRCAPHVAHVHNTWFSLSPSVLGALHRSKVPVVMTLHNYRLVCVNALLFRDGRPCRDCVGRSPLPGIRHRCYRQSAILSAAAAATISFNRARGTWANGVDRFIAPSHGLRDTLVVGGLPADRVIVRPHAVADVGARPLPPSSSSMVLYAGRISDEKGLDVLLDAWERARLGTFELVVAGDGPRRRELESREIDGVRFAGWLPPDEVRALMLTARALAFPSVCFEGFGASIVEAMSAGLPVVASAHGASAEIVGQVGPEWLAAPGNVQSWVERLESLADDRSLDAAAARGREIYASQYAPEQGVASLVDVYRAVIDEAGRR
jgi:glycosyltransferase involved in cell wall biosynthesis